MILSHTSKKSPTYSCMTGGGEREKSGAGETLRTVIGDSVEILREVQGILRGKMSRDRSSYVLRKGQDAKSMSKVIIGGY